MNHQLSGIQAFPIFCSIILTIKLLSSSYSWKQTSCGCLNLAIPGRKKKGKEKVPPPALRNTLANSHGCPIPKCLLMSYQTIRSVMETERRGFQLGTLLSFILIPYGAVTQKMGRMNIRQAISDLLSDFLNDPTIHLVIKPETWGLSETLLSPSLPISKVSLLYFLNIFCIWNSSFSFDALLPKIVHDRDC